MSGLVGIWRHDGREADRSAIAAMLAPIEHRGPDGMGIWQQEHVAFGHRKLDVLDLTQVSRQPMLTADGTGILIFDGEVYNYRELRQELENEGIQFGGLGDAEVVLLALHHWGPERAFEVFNGMFALAYFDPLRRALWLARDRVGIKPLLVADTGAELIFASEAKALLAYPHMEARVDRHVITKWILESGRGSYNIPFLGIDRIAPGTWWKVTEKGIDKRRYFHALAAVDVDRIVAASATKPTSFVSQFDDLLKRSVRHRLESRVPLAAMCSGGVDSSLIAARAREELPQLVGYVADVAFRDGEGDEAERVGQHLGIPIRRVGIDRSLFLQLWPYTVWHSDAPTTHPSDAALLAVVQTCRRDGVRVLLTGEGSDELFGGYHWQQQTYDEWILSKSWRQYILRGRLSKILACAPFASMIGRDPRLRPRLTLALDAEEGLLAQQLLALLAPIKSEADRAFIAHNIWSLYQYLPWSLHQHDRMGMAASMDMRVPFLDNEIFDFAFHLPRRATLHQGIGKWIVKQAAAKILPADIVYKKKKGFPMPHEFSRGTQKMLAGGMLPDLMGWSAKTTEDVVSLLGENAQLRFHFVGLELWLRIFFGKFTPATLGEKLRAHADDASSG
jgi:asparagine synthase (glutamine-hydrolysing)